MVNRVHKMEIAKQSSEKAWKMPFGVCPLYGVHFTLKWTGGIVKFVIIHVFYPA